MRPPNWNPHVELSTAEQKVVKGIRKAKLFVFLREIRHQLFNDEFQACISDAFQEQHRGKKSSSSSPACLSHHLAS